MRTILAIAATALLAGCQQRGGRALKAADKKDDGAPAAQETVAEAEALMENIQSLLGRPTANARVYEAVVRQLNQYIATRSDAVTPLAAEAKSRVGQLLGAEAAEAADRRTFDESDADYLDNAMFLQTIARNLRTEGTDLDYAKRLFDWVTRYIQLSEDGALPEGRPKDVAIRGNGSADERAWIFLELLRQAGIVGCRIGVPSKSAETPIAVWLCGAAADNEIYLFDPRSGISLPSSSGDKPATLRELATNPALADFLELPAPMPKPAVTSTDVKEISLLMIVDAPMLSPRMRFLQERLSGSSRPNLHLDFEKAFATLSGCLASIPGNQGVRIWKYPQLVGTRLRTDRQAAVMLLGSLNAFWLQSPRSPRLLQLGGQHEAAIRELVKLDLERTGDVLAAEFIGLNLPEEVTQRLVSQTRQDIVFFLGLSKLDDPRSSPSGARDWFDRYLQKYSSTELRLDDILNWPLFCADIGGILVPEASSKLGPNPLSPLIKKRLSEKAQKDVLTIAGDYLTIRAVRHEIGQYLAELNQREKEAQEAGNAEQIRQYTDSLRQQIKVRRELIEKTEGPHAAYKAQILQELNAMLKDKTLLDANALQLLAGKSEELKALSAKNRQSWTEVETRAFNRLALDAAFPLAVIKAQRFWAAASLRNRAAAFEREGKFAEAADSIEKDLNAATPFDRYGLQVYVKWLRRSPPKK